MLVAPQVQSMIAVTYVRDIDTSHAFYELLGFREHTSGKAGISAWSVMRYDQVSVLLAMTEPAPGIPPLPMLFYFFYEDLGAVVGALDRAGVPVTRTGHPPHALGGEVKVPRPGRQHRAPGAAGAASLPGAGWRRGAHPVLHPARGRRAGSLPGRRPAGM